LGRILYFVITGPDYSQRSRKRPSWVKRRGRAVRRLYSVGWDATANFGRRRRRAAGPNKSAAAWHCVIDFYAQVFQPKQPNHSHALTL